MQQIKKICLLLFSLTSFINKDILSEFFLEENESCNFINRWGFQSLCDHIFDPRTVSFAHPTSTEPGGVTFDPKIVRKGDLIFARDIELFFDTIHPYITQPYILITHGEFRDTCMEYHLSYLEDEKIIAWFSIHPPYAGHKKFHPIPLGIKQDKSVYEQRDSFSNFLKELRAKPKDKLLYCNFDCEQNPERQFVRKWLQDKPFCYNRVARVSFTDYMTEMAEFKFALSPRGWGPDCYRTWEALLAGVIPIVRACQFDQLMIRGNNVADPGAQCTRMTRGESQLDTLYFDLPILIVDSWEELTEDFLLMKYEELSSRKYSMDKLFLEYWYNEIQDVLAEYNEQTLGPTRTLKRSLKEKVYSFANDIYDMVINLF